MRFPSKESDVMLLADRMVSGFSKNSTFFSKLPVSLQEFHLAITDCDTKMNNLTAARAALDLASEEKKKSYKNLVNIMKKELKYAENTASENEAMLGSIGWSAKKTATPTTPPAACYNLKADKEGQGWISLLWQKSDKGGRPSAYTIERRTKEGDWVEVASTTKREKNLVDQPKGVLLYYRVIGFNKAGQSAPSNTIEATL